MWFSAAEARHAAHEAQLIAAIAGGTIEEPMRELCRRYERRLYRFGVQVLGAEGLAEEMVQETFHRLWRTAGRYDARRDRADAFLFEIARSVAAEIRGNRPSRALLPAAEDVQLPAVPDSVDQLLDSLRVREAFGKLSSPQAEVLRLALEEGLTQAEIARRLELPLDTVKTRTFHGVQVLRSCVGERVVMLAEDHVELAHPGAADWVLGTLEAAESQEFQQHLTSCGHCQAAVAEFGHVGRILQHLPPAAEPPPDLEERTIDSVLDAAAGDRTETHLPRYSAAFLAPAWPASPGATGQIPLAPPQLASYYRASPGTRHPRTGPMAGDREPAAAAVTATPSRRRRAGRYASTGVIVAVLVAAIAFLPGFSGSTSADDSSLDGSGAQVLIPLRSEPGTAASGQAMAQRMPGGWSIQLSVHGLKPQAGAFYECWFARAGSKPGHPVLISAGTFSTGRSGSASVSMWSAADPRQFRTVEITAQRPGRASQLGRVILTGVAVPRPWEESWSH